MKTDDLCRQAVAELSALLSQPEPSPPLRIDLLEAGDGVVVCSLEIGRNPSEILSSEERATIALLTLMDVTAGAVARVALATRAVHGATSGCAVVPVRASSTITAFPQERERLLACSRVVSHTPSVLIIEITVTGADNRRLARGWRTRSLGGGR